MTEGRQESAPSPGHCPPRFDLCLAPSICPHCQRFPSLDVPSVVGACPLQDRHAPQARSRPRVGEAQRRWWCKQEDARLRRCCCTHDRNTDDVEERSAGNTASAWSHGDTTGPGAAGAGQGRALRLAQVRPKADDSGMPKIQDIIFQVSGRAGCFFNRRLS